MSDAVISWIIHTLFAVFLHKILCEFEILCYNVM